MKRIVRHITLLALVLALMLAQLAVAETDETVKGIFDALTAEGSSYSQTKATYKEYYPDTVYTETLEDNGFTIAVSGNEYMNGNWTFTRDGDYLAITFGNDDFNAYLTTLDVVKAVGAYFGMNTSLITSYINGLGVLGIESDNFKMTEDEAAGTTTLSINISGPWDMKELDDMAFDEASLAQYEPLSDESTSMGGSCGKMMMIANGSVSDLTLLVGEYGGLDELAHRSIINIAKVLQPTGWEDFVANYTELRDAEAEGYTVRLNVDMATVGEIIDDVSEDYSFALIHFGAASADEGETSDEDAPAQAPTTEEFADGYFAVLTGLESGTAGASLKTAAAASDVCAFARDHRVDNPDDEPLRANMLAAYEALDEEAKAAFAENFEAVRALLDDYDANRADFEDAGVAEAMDEMMADPQSRAAWENLRDYTLALVSGN